MSQRFTMRRVVILGALIALNLLLAGRLVIRSHTPGVPQSVTVPSVGLASSAEPASSAQAIPATGGNAERISPAKVPVPATPFKRIYSSDPKLFVANLRGIHCPEETIKDIMVAEVKSRFRLKEEALRPRPADHVPYGWPANTSEA